MTRLTTGILLLTCFSLTLASAAATPESLQGIDWNDEKPRPKANGRWLCWAYGGKGNQALIITKAHPLSWYVSNLPQFDREIRWHAEHDPGWTPISSFISIKNKFAGQDVAEILFSSPSQSKPIGKMILLGARLRFRPVVWLTADPDVPFTPAEIVRVSGRSILTSRQRISGTGHFVNEDYFVFDSSAAIPVDLAFDSIAHQELSKILPHGLGVWKGGMFDIRSLRFAAPVWKDGDANCCPTAGSVNIQFAIRGNEVAVVSSHFEPPQISSKFLGH